MLKRMLFLAMVICVPLTAQSEEICDVVDIASCGSSFERNAPDQTHRYASASAESLYQPGDTVLVGQYDLLLNSGYYGLPPVRDGWVYIRTRTHVYRLDWKSHTILADVTNQTSATF
ncbi:hypothetical protein [Pseudaestuariivita rosea]|uniref:hypothetical protein n=1 Tax=Pseudaestuariivita rosea TaxID=2763263 RepID=UPI001ABB3684|nr:hypothetical protein [Pseudaestuariivita rosea]